MSDIAKQTAKPTDTTSTTKPGLIRRGLSGISRFEQNAAHTHPILTHAATTVAMGGAAKLAAPLIDQGVTAAKRIFGGGARAAGREVTSEVAKDGAKNFISGGGIGKLFRRR